jgi:hypothetical protein
VVAAHRARIDGGAVTAVVNAGRGRVHHQRFQVDGADVRPLSSPSLAELAAIEGGGMLAGEARLMAAAADAGWAVAPLRAGDEALATALRQAIGVGSGVAYDELRGEYGDMSMELTQ